MTTAQFLLIIANIYLAKSLPDNSFGKLCCIGVGGAALFLSLRS